MLLEPLHHDNLGHFYLRWPCYGCGCWTVPVDKARLDANDEAAISTYHSCAVCGHAVQLPRDLSNDLWWQHRNRAAWTEDWLTLDGGPLRRPWPDERPGLDDERLLYERHGDWRDRVRRVRASTPRHSQ